MDRRRLLVLLLSAVIAGPVLWMFWRMTWLLSAGRLALTIAGWFALVVVIIVVMMRADRRRAER